jgi:hypothetical protein
VAFFPASMVFLVFVLGFHSGGAGQRHGLFQTSRFCRRARLWHDRTASLISLIIPSAPLRLGGKFPAANSNWPTRRNSGAR